MHMHLQILFPKEVHDNDFRNHLNDRINVYHINFLIRLMERFLFGETAPA